MALHQHRCSTSWEGLCLLHYRDGVNDFKHILSTKRCLASMADFKLIRLSDTDHQEENFCACSHHAPLSFIPAFSVASLPSPPRHYGRPLGADDDPAKAPEAQPGMKTSSMPLLANQICGRNRFTTWNKEDDHAGLQRIWTGCLAA